MSILREREKKNPLLYNKQNSFLHLNGILLLPPASTLFPCPPNPPLLDHLQNEVRQEPIYDYAYTKRHEIHLGVLIQLVQVEHLLASLNGTLSVDPLPILAREFQTTQRIRCHVANSPLHRREMVPRLQEDRHIE